MALYKRDGEKLTDLVVSRIFEKNNSTNFPAQSATMSNISITIPEGYKTLCVARTWSSGDVLVGVVSSITPNQEVLIWWVNAKGVTVKPNKLLVEVLFIKQ